MLERFLPLERTLTLLCIGIGKKAGTPVLFSFPVPIVTDAQTFIWIKEACLSTPIFDQPTIEELIELKRKAGQVQSIQLKTPLAVEMTPLLDIEVDMWRDAIDRSDKSKYIALVESDGTWVAIWNADQFPKLPEGE